MARPAALAIEYQPRWSLRLPVLGSLTARRWASPSRISTRYRPRPHLPPRRAQLGHGPELVSTVEPAERLNESAPRHGSQGPGPGSEHAASPRRPASKRKTLPPLVTAAQTKPPFLFTPPSLDVSPAVLFPAVTIPGDPRPPATRFADLAGRSMAIFTDGCCLNNHTSRSKLRSALPAQHRRAGFAFTFSPEDPCGTFSAALELRGPSCVSSSCSSRVMTPTNNRAELRAVIAALDYRDWWDEGWSRVIVVTDSAYVATSATRWLAGWVTAGTRVGTRAGARARTWIGAQGGPIKNRDLWEVLWQAVGRYGRGGCEIGFWAVKREHNRTADAAAKRGAMMLEPRMEYHPIRE